jgi:oligosaccharide repeat unit polymerase
MLSLAVLSWASSSYEELAALAWVFLAANLLLIGSIGLETLHSRSLGKLLLAVSMLLFFWADSFTLAKQSPPFAVPSNMPVGTSQFDLADVQFAFFYVALFQLMLFVGYSLRPGLGRLQVWVGSRVDSRHRRIWQLRYAVAACGYVVLMVSYGSSVSRVGTALLASRSGFDLEWRDPGLLANLFCVGIAGSSLMLVQALCYRGPGRWLRFLWGALTSLPFLMLGTRHQLLFLVLPVALVFLRQRPGKLTPGVLLRWSGVCLLAWLLFQVEFAVRGVGWNSIVDVKQEQLLDPDTTGQFTDLLFAEHLVPAEHPYFHELAEPYFVTHWVPRSIWPGKPDMESWQYYNSAWTRGAGFNVTPSVIGQFHMNFGVLGVVFIGFWLGLLTYIADRTAASIEVNRQWAMAVVVGLLYAFVVSSFRFYSPIYLTLVVLGGAPMVLLTHRARDARNLRHRWLAWQRPQCL